MEKPANKPKPERTRDLLTTETDEEQRKHSMAEQEAKDAPAIGGDAILVKTNGVIKIGVIWA